MGTAIADQLAQRFAWADGHADVWRWFHDGPFLAELASALADPFRQDEITKVAGVEARGFILGALVAAKLRAGFVPIRKSDGLFPGVKYTRETRPDYRGNTGRLRIQAQSATRDDRVVLVDDWIETGSQAATARTLIESTGATFVGVSVVVDQLPDAAGSRLGRLHALIRFDALPAEASNDSPNRR